jgi:hypothetical protein
MQSATSSPITGIVVKVIVVILALVALYYLYKYLFGVSDFKAVTVVPSIIQATPATPFITSLNSLPALYEGGEYSINTWIYINDYSVKSGSNKHVLSLGGTNFLTLMMYLGPYKNSLHIRVHTKDTMGTPSVAPTSNPGVGTPVHDFNDLTVTSALTNMFNGPAVTNSDDNKPCDIPMIDMQKWVQVTVTINNKICDVYIDGKLARSCILSSFYKVDRNALTLKLLDQGGFGGFLSNTSVYNYSLNPEQVWRMYMSGPGQQYTFWQYVTSMFDPNSVNTMAGQKMNVTG